MHRRHFLLAATSLPASSAFAAPSFTEQPALSRHFTEAGVQGTLVIADERPGREPLQVHDAARAARRFTPASTFKVPHSLFALDAGILRDEFQRIPWDGVKRSVDAWNADQDLRSAVRNSTVWVYERFARQLGTARETAYLRRIGYGNARATGPMPFWVDGDLAISAQEQVAMLQRLYRNALPFRVEHQRLVKDVMVVEAGRDYILRAKTGWSGKIGWWVGWVERPQGAVFFALNMDTPNRQDDLPKRNAIVLAVLRSIEALPG